MDVSIIIVSYNTKKILEECLQSVIKNTKGLDYEIIVVDNASVDGTVNVINRKFPKVTLIQSAENLGFGRANNIGSKQAKGKYLFYLNSDTIVKNNAVKIFYDFAEKNNIEIGGLGCILVNNNNHPCHSYGRFITPWSELKYSIARYLRFLKDKSIYSPKPITSPMEVDYITGADLFVPKQVFEQTEGFDPQFFMYCEEVDLQKRMAMNGFKRIIIPGPQIVHLEGGSDPSKSTIWSPNRRKNFRDSKKKYYKKHFNKITYLPFRILQQIIDLPARMILLLPKYQNRPQ